MAGIIYEEIKNRIDDYKDGDVFFTSDFNDIASLVTIRKCLGRQVDEGVIRRLMDGIYEKPKYSRILKTFVPADPEKVAYAIARKYHWTIAPCGDVALNKLGLSTQVPVVWTYVSDGPYRNFSWDNIKISFKHKANREISLMSEISIIVVEALKTLGKDRVDQKVILILKEKLNSNDKETILNETTEVASWIYENIKRICK